MLKPYHNARVNGNTIHISGTLQELYDFVIGRLAKQGTRSVSFDEDNEPHCCYYNPCENIACAVGHIHPTFFINGMVMKN